MQYLYDRELLSSKIFDFLYGCAMHDAILQRAFAGRKDWVRNVEQAKPPLRTYLDRVLRNGFSSQEDHDACFLETANAICQAINSHKPSFAKDSFSFGNGQKLINILVKHTYAFCYHAPELRTHFRFCHCPLDSIMLNEVWKQYEKTLGKEQRREKLYNPAFFCQPWGCEGQLGEIQPEIVEFPERYLKFQTAIREIIGDRNLYPIEFDYLVWK